MSKRTKTVRLSDAEHGLLRRVCRRQWGSEEAVDFGFAVGELAIERLNELDGQEEETDS